MSAIITTSKVRREAVSASLASQQLIPIYRPSTYSMADITGRIVAAAAAGEKIYLGPGNYDLNINLPNGGSPGFGVVGAGRNRTFLISGAPNTPVFACQGLWYSKFEGLSFSHQQLGAGTMPAVDVDGKTGDNARGVQANTWEDCSFSGAGWYDGLIGNSAFWLCRVAGNAGQGSENMFINCHFSNATFACLAITGYNALNNQIIGGNFQSYTKHGIYLQFGSIHVIGVGFQSTSGITQINNDGWDISAEAGGVGDGITVIGCRTESLRFYKGNGAQPPFLMNCLQTPGLIEWFPNYTYQAGVGIYYNNPTNGIRELYRVLNTHTTGPTFAVAPNLELVPFNVIESIRGKELNCNWWMGERAFLSEPDNLGKECNADYTMLYDDVHIAADCTNNNVTITLYDAQKVPAGREVTVLRVDNNPNYTCTVYAPYFDNLSSFEDKLYATPEGRSRSYRAIGGGFQARRWYRTSSRLAPVQDNLRRFTGSAEATVVNGSPEPSPVFSIPIQAGATYEISGVIGFNGDTDLLSNFIARGRASGTNLFQDATFATRIGTALCDYMWTHDASGKEIVDRTVWTTVSASGPVDLVAETLNRSQGRCKFSFRITVATSASGNYDFRFYTRIAKVGTPTITGSWDVTATRIA